MNHHVVHESCKTNKMYTKFLLGQVPPCEINSEICLLVCLYVCMLIDHPLIWLSANQKVI